MFFIKFVLLMMCCVMPCIFISASDELKINWKPVCDDIEGNNEFVYRVDDTETDNGVQNCDAPNGLGLKNLFHQVEKILPIEQIKDIIKSFKDDDEIKALIAFIRSPQTQEKLNAIRNSPEYKILRDYTCRVLHIDLIEYNKLARCLIAPIMTRSGAEESRGIRGLINAIDAVIPYKKIQALYRNLLASDEELVKAVENLNSTEYRQLLLNVRNNVPEYKELINELKQLGVPVKEMREIVARGLGWSLEVTEFV